MNVQNWIENTSSSHITIDDILACPIGEPVVMFLITKEMFKSLPYSDEISPDTICKPTEYFRDCWFVRFTRSEGIQGSWDWVVDKPIQKRAPGCLGKMKCLFIDNKWVCITGSVIQRKSINPLWSEYRGVIHYSELPGTTLFGLKSSPLMRVSDMDDCGDILTSYAP